MLHTSISGHGPHQQVLIIRSNRRDCELAAECVSNLWERVQCYHFLTIVLSPGRDRTSLIYRSSVPYSATAAYAYASASPRTSAAPFLRSVKRKRRTPYLFVRGTNRYKCGYCTGIWLSNSFNKVSHFSAVHAHNSSEADMEMKLRDRKRE